MGENDKKDDSENKPIKPNKKGGKQYDDATKLHALTLYLAGHSILFVSKELDIGRQTIDRWKDIHNWDKIRTQANIRAYSRILTEVADNQVEIVRQHLNIGSDIREEFTALLKAIVNKRKTDPTSSLSPRELKDLVNAYYNLVRTERLILGMPIGSADPVSDGDGGLNVIISFRKNTDNDGADDGDGNTDENNKHRTALPP